MHVLTRFLFFFNFDYNYIAISFFVDFNVAARIPPSSFTVPLDPPYFGNEISFYRNRRVFLSKTIDSRLSQTHLAVCPAAG